LAEAILTAQLPQSSHHIFDCRDKLELRGWSSEKRRRGFLGTDASLPKVLNPSMVQEALMTSKLRSKDRYCLDVAFDLLMDKLPFHLLKLAGLDLGLCMAQQRQICAGLLFLVEFSQNGPRLSQTSH
jgi:hypothetical protein